MLKQTSGHSQRPDDTRDDDQENPTPPTIGDLLKLLRGDRTLRRVQNDTGIPNSYLSNLEMGRKNPGIKSLSTLANYYQVPLNGLMESAGLPFDDKVAARAHALIRAYANPEATDALGSHHFDDHRLPLTSAYADLEEVQRSYEFVLTDPHLGHYEKPAETPSVDTQKFVVRLYEHYTGKKLL